MIQIDAELSGELCDLFHQAGCEQMTEPDLDPDRLRFTGEMERTFADAVVEVMDATIVLEACAECGGDPDLYIVRDQVWVAGGLGDGHLCVSCLDQRLCRPLSPIGLLRTVRRGSSH